MSVGNSTQAVDFDRDDLTLVLGENIDLGGDDTGARNGTGKTTIINALSYALYGSALTNIRRENLVNKTNGKSMIITIDFEKDGQSYRIERGRKPNILRFFIGDQEQDENDDNAQGDSRQTQAEIERLLGMSHEMFKHVVALNTYTEPFLALKPTEQRLIIEQLLGITVLTEKADALKEEIKITKSSIQQEEANINAIQDANKRMQEQVEAMERRQKMWGAKHQENLAKLQTALDDLLKLDIDQEIIAHQELADYTQKKRDISDIDTAYAQAVIDRDREAKGITKLEKDISKLQDHKCNTCGQELHDNQHSDLLKDKETRLNDARTELEIHQTSCDEFLLAKQELGELSTKPNTFYDSNEDAIHHRSSLTNLQEQIDTLTKEQDPYSEQIEEMKATALAEIDYDKMNEVVRMKDHQEFLYKLLTNKDSYIRKRIIDQNLSYLNARLGQYLTRVGLPHSVVFMNDLSVEITELGRDLDFDNLSRGERNRLILSLSWAFRDVWESLYQPINLLFIDELLDSGLDTSGMEATIAVLKQMSRDSKKSVWLVSHRDELTGRVNNVFHVIKENGFTNYSTDLEIS